GTWNLEREGKEGFGAKKGTGVFAGGGAALGAIIGAIAGGGKGAAIGAGAGAGAGAVTQIATKGGAIKVPAETVLTFQLDKPVRIVEAQGIEATAWNNFGLTASIQKSDEDLL